MVDDLDLEEPDAPVEPQRRRGRYGVPRRSRKLLTMVPPSIRLAARRKLGAVHGIEVSGRSGLSGIARAIAVALGMKAPTDFSDATKLVLDFVARNGRPLPPPAAERPFVPLRLSLGMEIALARTREARAVAPSSDGSIVPKKIIPE